MIESEILIFPGLNLEFALKREAFYLFGNRGFPIYWYGILFGLGFIAASVYLIRRVREFGLDSDRVIDVLLGTVIGGMIGARLYYVIFSWDTYKGDLAKILDVRQGGIAMYGGIIGAILAMLLMCRLRRVKMRPVCDLIAGALLIAQSIGRWGNFVNIEAFGSPTNLPWSMTGARIESHINAIGLSMDGFSGVHPTFFYESMWCLIGFVLIAFYVKHRRFDGEITLMYLFWYGLGRSWIEGLRTDSLMLGAMRVSQVLAILSAVACLIILLTIRARIRREDNPEYMTLYVNTEEGKSVLAGTFYKKEDKAEEPQEPEAQPDAAPEDEDREISEEEESPAEAEEPTADEAGSDEGEAAEEDTEESAQENDG